jgi:hypothetical protein
MFQVFAIQHLPESLQNVYETLLLNHVAPCDHSFMQDQTPEPTPQQSATTTKKFYTCLRAI